MNHRYALLVAVTIIGINDDVALIEQQPGHVDACPDAAAGIIPQVQHEPLDVAHLYTAWPHSELAPFRSQTH